MQGKKKRDAAERDVAAAAHAAETGDETGPTIGGGATVGDLLNDKDEDVIF